MRAKRAGHRIKNNLIWWEKIKWLPGRKTLLGGKNSLNTCCYSSRPDLSDFGINLIDNMDVTVTAVVAVGFLQI